MIELVIGALAGLLTFWFIQRQPMPRQYASCAFVIVVMVLIYPFFALIYGAWFGLFWHSLIALAFITLALYHPNKSILTAAIIFVLHGNADRWFHKVEVLDVGPEWYHGLCASYDFVLAAALLVLFFRRKAA